MPVTRSATRAARITPIVNAKPAPKRQAASADTVVATKRTKASSAPTKAKAKANAKAKKAETETDRVPRPLIPPPSDEEVAPLPAQLTFSLEDAKDHLIQADNRFKDVFSRLPCKPFETLEGVHPFRSVLSRAGRLDIDPRVQNIMHLYSVSPKKLHSLL
jgi:DNA-3-methyladenine glycosylase II